MEVWQSPVYCTCLENRRSERVREFESHRFHQIYSRIVKWHNNRLITGHYKFDSCSGNQHKEIMMSVLLIVLIFGMLYIVFRKY